MIATDGLVFIIISCFKFIFAGPIEDGKQNEDTETNIEPIEQRKRKTVLSAIESRSRYKPFSFTTQNTPQV